jgi:anti-sigma B factor antagonist
MNSVKIKMEMKENEYKPEIMEWHIAGNLDSACIDDIANNFTRILKANRNYAVVDMTDVSFISSAAVGEFMECRQQLNEKGGDLVFSGLNIELRAQMNHLGANKIFRFHNDLRSAINTYAWEIQQKPEKVWLSFPPELDFVPPVRQVVSRIARQKGYGQRDAFRIETIVDEICNNAVEHGDPEKMRDIELSVKIDRRKIEIEIVNLSDPEKINSLKAISQSILGTNEKKLERGRGLSLIKMLSNDLAIDFSGKGTTVHVTKLREE